MILISPCCCTFENAATRLKDVATRLSHKLRCPNQSRQKTQNEILILTFSICIPLSNADVTTAGSSYGTKR